MSAVPAADGFFVAKADSFPEHSAVNRVANLVLPLADGRGRIPLDATKCSAQARSSSNQIPLTMFRKHLISSQTSGEPGFHWRGAEVTRLEGFTDAVFAFAVTLLVVSLEVPKTFPELLVAMHGFFAFGVCFALLANVWYQHYRFFRRYALENPWVVFLNCALLFFVLFYVYPLKFLFTAMFDRSDIPASEARALFTIWSLGYAAVFTVFTLLYLHAWRIRAKLELTPLEAMRTQVSLLDQLAMVFIALLSTALARTLPDRYVGIAGNIYCIVPFYFTIVHSIAGRRERQLQSQPPSV